MPRLNCGVITLEQPGGDLIVPVAEAFAANGCVTDVLYVDAEWRLDKYDFIVAYGPMHSMTRVIQRLAHLPCVPPLAFWFTEQMPSPQPSPALYVAARARYLYEEYVTTTRMPEWVREKIPFGQFQQRAGRLRALGEMLALQSHHQLNLVCAFTETNAMFMRHYNLPAVVIPMGYHAYLGEQLPGVARDIDVVFLGSTRDKRRGRLIAGLQQELARRRVNFVVVDGSPQNGYVFGRARTELLNRTKIMLNIMRQPWDDPVFRMLLAAPNGAMVLSERLLPTSTGPFLPGLHFAMTDTGDLADSILYYLVHDTVRHEIAAEAHDFVTRSLTMSNMARQLMHALGCA